MKIYSAEFKRSFLNFKFPICVLMVAAVSLLCCGQDLSYIFSGNSGTTIIELVDYLLGIGVFRNLILVIISIPFAGTYCIDKNNRYIYPTFVRCGVRVYSRAKTTLCATGAFSVCFLGFMLLVLILIPFMPLSSEQTALNFQNESPYGFLVGACPLAYLALRLFVFSMFSSVWAMCGLLFSTVMTNGFIAPAIPLVSYYFIGNLLDFLPNFLNINSLTNCGDIFGGNMWATLLYSLAFYFILLSIFVYSFETGVKRGLENNVN